MQIHTTLFNMQTTKPYQPVVVISAASQLNQPDAPVTDTPKETASTLHQH